MTSWREAVAHRLWVRFGIVLGILVVYPFPVSMLPKFSLIDKLANQPFTWLNHWVGEGVLGLAPMPDSFNGSGDRIYDYISVLVLVTLAILGAAIWTAVDRRADHPRLVAGLRIVLRYYLAGVMLSYGFSKILRSQYSDLAIARYSEELGGMSPMRLLWTFMDYSKPYTIFGGLAEAIGGVLLLWRRTATLGALIVAAVMTNVLMLNLCYDVPVKLFSAQCLIIAIALAAPRLRAVVAAAMGYATAEVPPRPRMSSRWELARWAARLTMVALLGWGLFAELGGGSGARLRAGHALATRRLRRPRRPSASAAFS
jgi:hypothetical protein